MDISTNWRAWSSVKDPGELESAILCFEEYFASPGQATMLDATGIIAIGRNAGRLADAMLAQAEKRAEGCYGNKPVNAVARKFFRDVTVGDLDQLFADLEFAKILQPAFQHAVLASQSRLEPMVRDIWQNQQGQQGLPLLVAQKLALRFGVRRDMLIDPGQIAVFLEAKAKEYVELKARLSAPSNEDGPIVQQLRQDAAELIDEGEFDAADDKLRQAEAHDKACGANWKKPYWRASAPALKAALNAAASPNCASPMAMRQAIMQKLHQSCAVMIPGCAGTMNKSAP
jgi:hypothetical protein